MKFYQEYIDSVCIHQCQFHKQTCMHKEYTSENRKIIIIILRGKHPSSSSSFFFLIFFIKQDQSTSNPLDLH